jgi:ubiquinone biosynthesis protein
MAGLPGGPGVVDPPATGASQVVASTRRAAEVAGAVAAMAGHIAVDGTRHRLSRSAPAGRSGPDRFRLMLEELGPTFIKLGQLLAGRPELLPSAYRTELTRLRDDTAPLPGVVVLRLLSRAYDRPLDSIFASISLQPVASGSIGQVHRATLVDGRSVAVKIQRPEAARTIEADLRTLRSVVRTADRFAPPVRRLALVALVDEFAEALEAELDYGLEATHTGDVARRLRPLEWVTVPKVVPFLCRPGVLVMEFAEGIPLTDRDALDRAGIDRRQLASRVVAANLQLILFSDIFHADPHAGNYLAAPDGHLVVLDFGQVGRSTPQTRADLLQLLTSLVSGDAAQVARAVGSISGTDPEDIDGLGDDVARLVSTLADQPLGEFRIGVVLRELVSLLGRHHLAMPSGMTMLVKAVIECEATAEELSSEIRLSELLPFLGELRVPSEEPMGLVRV